MNGMLMTRALLGATLMVLNVPVAAATQGETSDATPESTEWQLVAYAVDGELWDVPWHLEPAIVLDAGRATGSAGCNWFETTYEIDGPALTFGKPATGDVGCSDETLAVEKGYMADLLSTERWAMSTGPTGDRILYLYDADDDVILTFEEPTVGLTPSDVRSLADQLASQQQQIDRLTKVVAKLSKLVGA